MMIGPEGYYEEKLKGKSAAQIMTAIRSLKREMNRLKDIIEHPEYQCMIHPSDETQLWCFRLYLARAKEALAEQGEVYKITKNEQKALDFATNIPNISKINFHIGGFFGPNTDVSVDIDQAVHIYINEIESPITFPSEDYEEYTKKGFFDSLKDLHIGEWSKHYDLKKYDMYVLDGTQWELIIEYNNGRKPFKSGGDNAYPYNFNRFLELLGLDEELYDDSAEDEE